MGDASVGEKAKTYFEGVKGKDDLESKFSNLFCWIRLKVLKSLYFNWGFQVNGDLSLLLTEDLGCLILLHHRMVRAFIE